jgi:hypothetical protein
VAGQARARLGARRQGARERSIAPRAKPLSPFPAATCPRRLQPCRAPCIAGCRGSSAAARTSSSARSARAFRSGCCRTSKLRAESDDLGDKAAHVGKTGRVPAQAQARPRHRARGASDAELRQALRQPEGADDGAQQVQGLRRQSRPLLRHRRVQPARGPQRRREGIRHRARAERSRQARPDRFPEDRSEAAHTPPWQQGPEGLEWDYVIVGSGAGGWHARRAPGRSGGARLSHRGRRRCARRRQARNAR